MLRVEIIGDLIFLEEKIFGDRAIYAFIGLLMLKCSAGFRKPSPKLDCDELLK